MADEHHNPQAVKAMSGQQQRQEARTILRAKGLRTTPARVAILNELGNCAGPVTHQELTLKLHDLGLEKSTIFRGLQDLTEAGLLHRLELGDHLWRYELVQEGVLVQQSDSEHTHPHLLCVDCGSVRCLNQADVNVQLAPQLGKVVDVLIKGQCPDCGEPTPE
ncbi:MAG: transcriptional repressor [Pirellulaceae bacterium]|nr:transcriptional repressor [Pirellulaceae bacterium]